MSSTAASVGDLGYPRTHPWIEKLIYCVWLLVLACALMLVVPGLSDKPPRGYVLFAAVFLLCPLILGGIGLRVAKKWENSQGWTSSAYWMFSVLCSGAYWSFFVGTLVVGGDETKSVTLLQQPWRLRDAYRNLFLAITCENTLGSCFALISTLLSAMLPALAIYSFYRSGRQISRLWGRHV